jgi:hypothetical protein
MTRHLKLAMALIGLIGFVILMALRDEVSGTTARSAMATGAFVCAAIALVSIVKR